MALAKLSIDLTAKIASFEKELRRSTQLAEQQSNKMAAALGLAGKALGAFGAGLSVAGIASFVRSTADMQREMLQLSRVAGTTTDVFSGLAFGAERFNVSSEKLADILKDTQDKLGDFLQNGAGPMKDFFENIAPQVGLTADAFRNLSGPEVLQKYYNALRQANLTQAETVFYMEALASDATNLIPLLEDNGRGFADAAEEARKFGKVVSQDAAQASAEFDRNMRLLEASVSSLGVELANRAIPELTRFSNELLEGMERSSGFWDALRTFGTINPFRSAESNLATLRNDLAGLEEKLANPSPWMLNTAGLEADIDRVRRQIGFLEATVAPSAGAGRGLIVPPLAVPRNERTPLVTTEPPKPKLPNSPLRNTDAELYLRNLQRQLEATQSLTAQETLLRDISLGRLGAVTDAQREELQNLAEQLDAKRLQAEADAERLGLMQIGRQLAIEEAEAVDQANARWEALLDNLVQDTAVEQTKRLIEQIKVLDEAMIFGRISSEQWAEALGNITERQAETKDAAGELKMTFSSAFEDAVVKGAKVSDMLNGLVADIARIALRKAITEPLGNSLGGLFGNIFSGIFGGPRAAGGPVNYGKAYLVGEKGPEIFMPQGNGNIVPNNRLGGQMVYSPVFNFNGPADQALVITAAHMGAAMGRQAVYDDMARGRLS